MPLLRQSTRRHRPVQQSRRVALLDSFAQTEEVLLQLNSEELHEMASSGFEMTIKAIFHRRAEHNANGTPFIQDKGTALWNTRYADAVRALKPRLVMSETPAERRLRFWGKTDDGKQWAESEAAEGFSLLAPTTFIRASSGPSKVSQTLTTHKSKLLNAESDLIIARLAYEEVVAGQTSPQDANMLPLRFKGSSPDGHELLIVVAGEMIFQTNELPTRLTDKVYGEVNSSGPTTPSGCSNHVRASIPVPDSGSTSVSPVKNLTKRAPKRRQAASPVTKDAGKIYSDVKGEQQRRSKRLSAQWQPEDTGSIYSPRTRSKAGQENSKEDEGIIGLAQPTGSSIRTPKSPTKETAISMR